MVFEQSSWRKSPAKTLSSPGTRGKSRCGVQILRRNRVFAMRTPAGLKKGSTLWTPASRPKKGGAPRTPASRLMEGGADSILENLHQDILTKILCYVNHSDLVPLLLVSKTVNKSTNVAKEKHFAFTTPTATVGLRRDEESSDDKHQWGPKQRSVIRPRFDANAHTPIIANLEAAFSDPE